MSNLLKKMEKKQRIDKIKNADRNRMLQAAANVAEKQANEKALNIAVSMMESLSSAMEGVFREHYGYGDKRLYQLMQRLNERLPAHLQFGVKKRDKIETEKLYDIAEVLIEINCNYKACKIKSYKDCKYYTMFSIKGIPTYDDEADAGVCPYRVTPGQHKLNEFEIKMLRMMISDRQKRMKG